MLGPRVYGNFTFLLFSFTQVSGFLGTGNNFLVTRLASNYYNKKLISFYWYFVLTGVTISILCMIPLSIMPIHRYVFPNQELSNIWIIFILVMVMYIVQLLETMVDTCGLTRNSSILRISVRTLSTVFLITIVFVFNIKNLFGVYVYQYLLWGLLLIGLTAILLQQKIPMYPFSVSFKATKEYIKPFYEYTNPLFFIGIANLPINFLKRWLLQFFGGSIEQGYFSLSNALGSFVILFSNALSPLLLREFSISISRNDNAAMSSLFIKSIYILFAFSAYMSIFLMLQASKATTFLGGNLFSEAILPVSIMVIYPIPYTVNNILYSVLYSTNKTKLLRNMGLLFSGISLIITFILIAPNKYFGLELGAVGFAISMLIPTSIKYLVLLKYCVSIMALSRKNIILNHLIVITIFVSLGIFSIEIADHLTNNIIVSFLISGIIYTIGVVIVFIQFPSLLGISLLEIISQVKMRLSKANYRKLDD